MKVGLPRFPFNAVSTIFAVTGVTLFKLHDLTTFHVFVLLFFLVVFLLMYIERNERKYKEVRGKHGHRTKTKRFFMQRSNVLFLTSVWFYITYSIVGKDIYFTEQSTIATNLLSVTFVLIAFGSSFYRKRFKNAIQEKIMVMYVLLLCFPMNLLQHTPEVFVGLRLGIFFLIYNLELYVGKTLQYKTTYKQLVLCSYFVFVVNIWYLVASVPIVLTHFLEIKRYTQGRRYSLVGRRNSTENDESSYYSSSSEESDVLMGMENGEKANSNQNNDKRFQAFSAKKGNEKLFTKSKGSSKAGISSTEELHLLLSAKGKH